MNNKYSDASILDAVTNGATSAADVADIIGCNPRVATNRLKVLVSEGKLEALKKRGRWTFWMGGDNKL